MRDRIWNRSRQWAGNLIPILCVLPFTAISVLSFVRDRGFSGIGLGVAIAGVVIGWIALNFFGLYGNQELRSAILRKVLAREAKNASQGIFVGFATPAYRGLLDAHEDLGFLFVEPDRLEFVGEVHHIVVQKREVRQIRARANIHTLLGLGGWVSVEGVQWEQPFRLLIEPRQANSLAGNVRYRRELRQRLARWLRQ